MAQAGPTMAQDGPRWHQEGSRWHQDGPRMARDGPKMAQDSPKMTQDAEKRPSLAMRLRRYGNCAEKRPSLAMRLRRYCNCTVVRTPRGTPRWAKTFPGCARVRTGSRPGAAPDSPQERTKMPLLATSWPSRPSKIFNTFLDRFFARFSLPTWALNRPKSIKNR